MQEPLCCWQSSPVQSCVEALIFLCDSNTIAWNFKECFIVLYFLNLLIFLSSSTSSMCVCVCLFYRYYFGRFSSELAQMISLPYSTRYSDWRHDSPVTIPISYKDVCINSFFPRRSRLCNCLPIECFPLTYYLNGLGLELTDIFQKCRFFLNRFWVCFNLFVLLFLVPPYLVGAFHSCMEWIPI